MTPETLYRNNPKWPEVKILQRFSNQKVKVSTSCGGVFVYYGRLGVIYDFQATNGSATGGGGSHRASTLLPIGQLGVIYTSQPHSYALFYSHSD
jgi:hypothetical protein